MERSADVRYTGQGYELNVSLDGEGNSRRDAGAASSLAASSARMIADFHAAHQRRYGYAHPRREVEIVTLRLRARLASPPLPRLLAPQPIRAKREIARVVFHGRAHRAVVLERAALVPGRSYAGPAIVTEYSATTAVPPGMRFGVDRVGNLVIQIN